MPKLLVKHYKLVLNKYSAPAVPLEPEELSKWFTQIHFVSVDLEVFALKPDYVRFYFKQAAKHGEGPSF